MSPYYPFWSCKKLIPILRKLKISKSHVDSENDSVLVIAFLKHDIQ